MAATNAAQRPPKRNQKPGQQQQKPGDPKPRPDRSQSPQPLPPPSTTPDPKLGAAVLVAALIAGALLVGGGDGAASSPGSVAAGEQLARLVASVRGTPWGEGTPLGKKLQHSLGRPPKGASPDSARSFVLGGDRAAAGGRAELVGLLAVWVQGRSQCPAGTGEAAWRVDADGATLDGPAAEALLTQLTRAPCAATLVVVANAQRVHIDVMQQFEPLLSGEGPSISSAIFLVLDVESPEQQPEACPAKRGVKRYNCMEEGLQDWVRSSIWKRRGLLGRITQWIPLG